MDATEEGRNRRGSPPGPPPPSPTGRRLTCLLLAARIPHPSQSEIFRFPPILYLLPAFWAYIGCRRTGPSLPVKLGGVGLRSAEQHSSAAFIASNIQSSQAVDKILSSNIARRSLHNTFSLLQRYLGNATFTSKELLPPNSNQHSLSRDRLFSEQ